MKIGIKKSPLTFFILGLMIAVPAFFINLGDSPVIDDEAIRAIVAFEMSKSGEFVTPLIGGDYYFKKPPAYNWVIAASYHLFDDYSEFPVRFPMIISLFIFTLAIYYYFRKEVGEEVGIITALMFLTSGRIIIYESLYGLIDITYSFLIFMFFIMIYRAFNAGKLLTLFLVAYFLSAVTFLMKGFPSVVFLGISLLVLFVSHKKFKLLFNWRHYLGMLVFLVIVGGYYILYFTVNDISPNELWSVLFGESSRRTVVRFGFWKMLETILTFPFDVIYHFLPWTLFVLVLFTRGSIKKIKNNAFLKYISLILIFNILIYWTSPEVYARYLLMFVPLFYGVFAYFYVDLKKKGHLFARILEILLGISISIIAVASLAPLFMDLQNTIQNIIIYSVLFFIAFATISYFYWKQDRYRVYWLVMAILAVKLAFMLVVIPIRLSDSNEVEGRELAYSIAEKTADNELYLWWIPGREPSGYYRKEFTSYRFHYYMSVKRDEIIPVISEKHPDAYYISPEWGFKKSQMNELDRFQPPSHSSPLILFKFKEGIEWNADDAD